MSKPKHTAMPAVSSGPFSPTSVFTTRRVWIKKQGGTPTTLVVSANDIFDDVKVAVMNKFPNSLAREFDPADLTIKMDLQTRLTANAGASSNNTTTTTKQQSTPSSSPAPTTNQQSSQSILLVPQKKLSTNPTINKMMLHSPDAPRPPQSPSTNAYPSTAYSLINLEPDQNVWQFLDSYYPNGMSMQEALVIETPQHQPAPNARNNSILPQYANSVTPVTRNSYERSTTPVSFGSTGSTGYYQPKPQHYSQANLTGYPSIQKDRSVSPATVSVKTKSPVGSHRRSHSNPPQSPVTNNKNPQAVLLLPKNFSLSGPSHNEEQETARSKRLSFDESIMQKPKALGMFSPIRENETAKNLSSNLTNIGVEPKKPETVDSEESIESGRTERTESNSTITLGNIHDSLPASPSPSNVVERLNSPSRDTPSAAIELPINDGSKKTPSEEPAKSSVRKVKPGTATDTVLPSISVLVVEDNAINQAILGAFLRKHKIHYQIAKNGEEAIQKWRKGGFHLVLMDIQLPVKSGIEATKEIRYLEKINRIGVFAQHELASNQIKSPSELLEDEKLDLNVFRSPVIIVALTASSNSSVDRKNALTAGCNDYLTKPVNLVWLQNKITEWGCMQALIDFDGWRIKGHKKIQSNDKPENQKALTASS